MGDWWRMGSKPRSLACELICSSSTRLIRQLHLHRSRPTSDTLALPLQRRSFFYFHPTSSPVIARRRFFASLAVRPYCCPRTDPPLVQPWLCCCPKQVTDSQPYHDSFPHAPEPKPLTPLANSLLLPFRLPIQSVQHLLPLTHIGLSRTSSLFSTSYKYLPSTIQIETYHL